MSEKATTIEFHRLTRYLADAYKRGADHQLAGEAIGKRDDYEGRVRESECWASEYVDLRRENGLLRDAPPDSPPPSQPGDEA